MELGAFSISLTVRDIEVSRVFYEKLGFTVFGGEQTRGWLIMKNGAHLIGLFHGMFDRNTLTFNPGWDQDGRDTESFTDIRDIQRQLIEQGLDIAATTDESGSGPGSILILDPDGNPILIDQHR
jgi:catechol 2,3-dioxygenase-like lactoylglutathione lyase family enzyme